MFEHARDSTDECKEMTFLKRASHFLLLLDSAKGIDPEKRWAMFEDAEHSSVPLSIAKCLAPIVS